MTISVVGIGSGADVTSDAAAALREADVVIGHDDFIAAVGHLVRADADCCDVQAMAGATADILALRARSAIDRALAGAQVAIVSGGDPGLLGMAGPFLRSLHSQGDARPLPAVRILPCLSAWQYASARLGAFCVPGMDHERAEDSIWDVT